MTEIINMTPHPINIVEIKDHEELGTEVVNLLTIPVSGNLIRLKSKTVHFGSVEVVEGLIIPITMTEFGTAEGLPDKKEGVFYIVSQLVKSALPNRTDLLVPAEVQRDQSGNIIGCLSLGV